MIEVRPRFTDRRSYWHVPPLSCMLLPMQSITLSQFTLREKLQIMQSIWEDLRSHVDRIEVPQSHKDILDERRRRIEIGEAKLLDWEVVKHTICKR